jgi:DNA-binding IclR family transcriptional regulator
MVFPAHRTTAGLLLLAELPPEQVEALYAAEGYADRPDERLDLSALRVDLARARRSGFVLNKGRSERGVVAIGVPVRAPDGEVLAGLSVSIPSVRYSKEQLPTIVGTLRATAGMLERDLRS